MFTFFNKIIYLINSAVSGVPVAGGSEDSSGVVSPIYDFLDTFGPALIGILLGVGSLYCIILGVQYAKAEKGEERDVAKKKAVNAAISFGVIIILVAILYGMRGTFVELLSE